MSDPRGFTRTRTGEDASPRLDEHEREFRRLTEHAKEVFWIGDPGRFGTVYANPAFEEVWGRSREELYENPGLLLESIHPEDRERVVDAVETEIERGGVDETYRIERPDGELRWIHDRSFPVENENGEIDDVVGIAVDVTDRKRRERTLSTVHEATNRMMRAESGEEVCEFAVAAATELSSVSRAAVYAFDSETHALRPAAWSPAAREFVGARSRIDDGSPIWEAFVDGETRVIDDGSSTAVIPIGTHGTLVVPAHRAAAFDEETVSLARLLCDDAEAALGRIEREATLHERGETLQQATEELERLTHVADIVRNVTRAIVRADSRDGITSTVCEQLAAADPYRFAWIGEVVDGGIDPEAWSGIPGSYLGKLEPAIEADDSAAARAAHSGELAVDRALLEDRDADRRTDALSWNYQSIAAVPLTHRERSYGVLCVYADRADAFGERERGVLRELGETIGYALDAMETRNALASDGATELRLRIRDPGFAPQRLADEGRRIEHRGVVFRGDGTSRWFVVVDGTTPERLDELVEGIDRFETARSVVEADALYELIIRPPARGERPCLFDETVEHGGRVGSMTATSEEVTVTVELPTESAVRRFIESLRSDYRNVELVGRRDHDRPSMAREGHRRGLVTGLTDRQREILQVAYFSGYFEDPRETTGAEIAERLGINRSTFHRTLRAAERASFAALLD